MGCADDITYEFSKSLNPQERTSATTMVTALSIKLNLDVISRVTTLPLGIQWRKEDKANNTFAKKNFFLNDEQSIEDKIGVRRESLPYL